MIVKQFYKQRLADASEEQQDTHALDQGEYRTKVRHDCVVSFLGDRIKDGVLMDIGCGTGLLLDRLAEEDKLPSVYIGTDILEERRHYVLSRAKKYQIEAEYYLVDEGVPVIGNGGPDPVVADVVTCVGITGFWGVHTYAQNLALYNYMRTGGAAGCIVYPMFYDPNKMGVTYLTRFDPQDLLAFFGIYRDMSDTHIHLLEREFVLWWR